MWLNWYPLHFYQRCWRYFFLCCEIFILAVVKIRIIIFFWNFLPISFWIVTEYFGYFENFCSPVNVLFIGACLTHIIILILKKWRLIDGWSQICRDFMGNWRNFIMMLSDLDRILTEISYWLDWNSSESYINIFSVSFLSISFLFLSFFLLFFFKR